MESKENNLSDAKYVHELSKDDILGLEFDDLEDVYEFYKEYASAMGFGVRKGSCRRNKDGIEVMKHFACSKEGHKVEKWEKAREPASLAKERKTLLEFVRAIEDEIKNIRNNEIGEDYISIHTEPVSSQIFKVIEKYTASVYTGRTFKKFIDEMRLQQLFYHECRIDNEPSIRVYHLMKLCHVASQFVETFNKARSEIASLTRRYDEICKVNTDGISNLTEHVYDPTRVKVKGKVGAKTKWKKKPRKCGNCKKEGHTRNKCPQLELTLYSLESSSCLLDDNDVDVYERNKEVWPSQLETLFGGDSLEVFTRSYFCVAGALVGLLKPGRMSMFGTLLVIWGLVNV
ncbi:FAR1 DNA binding domain - like 10 [Theobroma cacao]|nr:FAR1 DNA binding domain - like 10 [Theobroma cacao]